ncbi:MAG TPA: Glu/Leu/Phe/Val dehydrogenase dimerization domain-containing protein [Candidatus Didemnitutus sp.]|nr:Glu/Leu/Phe/Val dehydrogenase dimerization domain-containing protein [Candidatus Didemnitutus sp.]
MQSLSLPRKLAVDSAAGADIERRYRIAPNEFGPRAVHRLHDPTDDRTWGFVVVDNLARGRGLGGVRMAADVTVEEIYGLAHAMTMKSAAAMLPLGGAKSGLAVDPRPLAADPGAKRALMAMFAEALWSIPEYIPGPDMGTNESDMQAIYESFSLRNGSPHHGRGGVGRPPSQGGFPLDEWAITAHGLFAAAMATEKHLPDFRVKDSSVIIQGFGNVGAPIAEKLSAAGARIVGASDINAGLYHPDGLDLPSLLAARKRREGLAGYPGAVRQRFDGEHLDRLMELPCTILVPAARPHAIHPDNAPHIHTRVVLQGANNPADLVSEYYLQHRRGIVSLTDFIVNSGGVIAACVEARADVDAVFRDNVKAEDGTGRAFLERVVTRIVTENIDEMFSRRANHRVRDITWREIANEIARDRLRPGPDGTLRVIPELR